MPSLKEIYSMLGLKYFYVKIINHPFETEASVNNI